MIADCAWTKGQPPLRNHFSKRPAGRGRSRPIFRNGIIQPFFRLKAFLCKMTKKNPKIPLDNSSIMVYNTVRK